MTFRLVTHATVRGILSSMSPRRPLLVNADDLEGTDRQIDTDVPSPLQKCWWRCATFADTSSSDSFQALFHPVGTWPNQNDEK